MTDLLQLMVESRQLSASDAEWLAKQHGGGAEGSFDSEPEILRWLAQEYAVSYSDLEQVEVEKEVLSLFPARLLLKEEL
ncbi:MAG: type II/IV secretion system protein, partial [Limisphaerales bacterium]